MTCREVADELVRLCQQGEFEKAAETLYAQDIVSIEAVGDEQMPAEIQGMDAVRQKGEWWYNNHEIHRADVEGPFMHHDQFSVVFSFDVTVKATGDRVGMREIGVYTVEDGKIVREQFFYTMN